MKKCNKCNNMYEEKDFGKNKNVCKNCIKKYHKEYYHNIRKYKKKDNKRLIKNLIKEGFEYGSVNMDLIKNLKWDMIDYPERPHLKYSLSHKEFMIKYNLNISTYIYIRELVKENKFDITSKDFFIKIF